MNTKGIIVLIVCCILPAVGLAQKVKYKDLMVLLNAKQYDQAEPHLKKYLKENTDNPSAYLFMAITYHEKSLKNDVLKQTEILTANIDSAILFYDKAYPIITEKEIKRNSENYQMYTRRDLITGEFGVKQSDVLLDIETRTKGLKERKEKVKLLKNYFKLSEAQYLRANNFYKELQEQFDTKKELYLLSDDVLVLSLEKLASTFDSCQATFKNYKTTTQAIGKTGYNQTIDLLEIKDFKKEGSTLIDFMEDDLKLWNYSEWSKKTIRIIKDEVYPVRNELLVFDSELNKLREKIKKDSLPVNALELKKNPLFTNLKKWDNDPMPSGVFNMKISELEYMTEETKKNKLKGGENIPKRIQLVKNELHLLKSLDSATHTLLTTTEWEQDAKFYKSYISGAYGTVDVLKNLIHSMQEFSKREAHAKTKELEELSHSLKWVVDESDSIPLFKDVPDELIYRPMVIAETYTAGVKLTESHPIGYFYSISPARTAEQKITFQVDTATITSRNIPLIKGISLSTAEPAYFVLLYSESKVEGKTPVSLAKISKKNGLEWTSTFSTDLPPVDMKYTAINGELSIRTSGIDGDNKIVALDKTGKRLQ
jgi:hypothetical protein